MIQNLKIDWEHCFGIRKLRHEFSFTDSQRINLIYAPNGTMKTSFAKVMRFLSGQSKSNPQDQLHKDLTPKHETSVDGNSINKDDIYVINGEDDIDSSAAFVNFLASSELKAKYDAIYRTLTKEKEELMKKLKTSSQSTDCETEILNTFKQDDNDTIFSILERLNGDLTTTLPAFDFRYNDVFDSKGMVRQFLQKNHGELQNYIKNYEQLLANSTLFHSVNGCRFGTYQAAQLVQSVADGGFFGVKHKLVLKDKTEITSVDKLKDLIDSEHKKILEDDNLRKAFEKITKAIDKNAELRGFKAVIEQHHEWIVEIINYEEFRKKVWLGHLSKPEIKALFDTYINVYRENEAELRNVLEQANREQEKWKEIIELYNERFLVPVKVSIANQRDVILKHEAAKLSFSYVENGLEIPVKEKGMLNSILSRGERRAFIILQFIFEMEARKTQGHDTLLIMDDIADSFDYQNKYAIIEYIRDLAEDPNKNFALLLFTHNYDFYRTVASRLNVDRKKHLWMVNRLDDGSVELKKGEYAGNVFIKAFIGNDNDDKIFISMIPFVRNLIEYTKGIQDIDYLLLTKCFHLIDGSEEITETDVINIIKNYTQGKGMKRQHSTNKMLTLIDNTAEAITKENDIDPVLIQNKIVLSIAIRIRAEKYLHDKLLEHGKSETELKVNKNQTREWTKVYKKSLSTDANCDIIERVNMMTPEQIHLNSFMFEPLIDMSVHHLVQLYNDCKARLI